MTGVMNSRNDACAAFLHQAAAAFRAAADALALARPNAPSTVLAGVSMLEALALDHVDETLELDARLEDSDR